MFIQPNTISDITNLLSELKCKMASIVYKYYLQEEYALKKCSSIKDFEKYSVYIELLERKLQNIKNQIESSDVDNPSVTYYTDVDNVVDDELYLTDCDSALIHTVKRILK